MVYLFSLVLLVISKSGHFSKYGSNICLTNSLFTVQLICTTNGGE